MSTPKRSTKRRSIPDSGTPDFFRAVKENFEVLTGVRGTKIKPLSADASNADIVAKVNEILALLQP